MSISCGVAALVDMPQGLARALAAAEIACKKAKKRGRNRVELYACEDSSMMRRQDDIAAVGQLRAAFKADRLLLYAQRIVPLQRLISPGGYEILMRLRDPDGTMVAPGALIAAAHRYQLLPSIDRWVMQRTLQMLAPLSDHAQHTAAWRFRSMSRASPSAMRRSSASSRSSCKRLTCRAAASRWRSPSRRR